jgi:osmoprotectant transport system permease protein
MYRALGDGNVDVISGFTGDGRIAAMDLIGLVDSLGSLPAYDALLVIPQTREKDFRLTAAIRPLVNAIKIEDMRAANYMVDRDVNKATPGAAAKYLEATALRAQGTR